MSVKYCFFFALKFCILDAPGKPDPPECTETTRSTITVTWKPPSNDGGNTITHYTLEKMVAPHGDWEPASRAPIRGTNYTVAKLKEGTQYQFRVKAVNDAGAGKPSDESDVFIAEPTPSKFWPKLYFLLKLLNLRLNRLSYYSKWT